MKRKATAIWSGTGKDGLGYLRTESLVLDATQFSFKSRFADGKGTNPEELLAASHASCFTMKLSFVIQEKGFVPEKIETTAVVTMDQGSITRSHLIVDAKVVGLSDEIFATSVIEAKDNCPISKVLNTQITLESTLVNA